MIRKFLAAASIAVVGLVAAPGVAQAYTPPEAPELEILIDPDDIVIGQTQVPFEASEFLAGSEARFAVSGTGVSSSDIGLTVLESGDGAGATAAGSIDVTVAANGTFKVGVVFPEAAEYLISTTGFNSDGTPRTVSMTLDLGRGGGSGGGGGLPNTGFSSFNALLAGAGLAGLGAGAILLSRRSSRKSVDSNV